MHSNILEYVIFPNVGYERSLSLVNEKYLNYAKKALTKIEIGARRISFRHFISNCKFHFLDGVLHRENGPAVTHEKGLFAEWWVNGKKGTKPGTNIHQINRLRYYPSIPRITSFFDFLKVFSGVIFLHCIFVPILYFFFPYFSFLYFAPILNVVLIVNDHVIFIRKPSYSFVLYSYFCTGKMIVKLP